MKKISALAFVLLLSSLALSVNTRKLINFVDDQGLPRTDITSVTVLGVDTGTESAIYADIAGEYPIANPMSLTSSKSTVFPAGGTVFFCSEDAKHDIVVVFGDVTVKYFDIGGSISTCTAPNYMVLRETGSNTVYINPSSGDSAGAIQAELDRLEITGGSVICQSGAYSISAPIKVPSNVTLEFLRPNTITIPATNTIDDDTFTINAISPTPTAVASLFRNKNAGTGDRDCNIQIKGANIDFEAGPDTAKFDEDKHYFAICLYECDNSVVEGCNAVNVVYDGFDGNSNVRSLGVAILESTNTNIKNCYAAYCGYEGFAIRGGCENCYITDCVAEYNRVHSMQISCWAAGGFTLNPVNCGFVRCEDLSSVTNWPYTSSPPVNQIMVHGQPDATRKSKNIKFTDCQADSLAAIYECDGVTFQNCNAGSIILNPEYDVSAEMATTVQNVLITGCNLLKGSQYKYPKLRFGNLLTTTTESYLKNVIVSNCVIKETSTVSFTSGGTTVPVSGNTLTQISIPFNSGGTYTPVVGNTIEGVTSGATAVIGTIAHTSGTWAGGDEVGRFYFHTLTGSFQSGEVLKIGANADVCTTTALATSSTAVIESVHTTSGTFAAGTAAGNICLTGQTGSFAAAICNIGTVKVLTFSANSTLQYGVMVSSLDADNGFSAKNVLIDSCIFQTDGFNGVNTSFDLRIEAGGSDIDGVVMSNCRLIPGLDTSRRPIYLQAYGTGNITKTRILNNEGIDSAAMAFLTIKSDSTGIVNGLKVEGNYWNRASTYSFIQNVAGDQLNIYVANNETAGNTAFYTITAGSVTQAPGSGANIIHLGTDADDTYTITTADNGATFTNLGDTTDALTFVLPAATVGLKYRFEDRVNAAAVDLNIDPDIAETPTIVLTLAGTDMDAGEQYQSENDTYASVEVECFVTGKWTLKNIVGTWAQETP